MANTLTGSFDVVAEFAIPAANRVLAAMHRSERFIHSLSVSVDDSPHGPKFDRPSVVGVVDTFGDPIVNHGRFGRIDLSDLNGASAGSGGRDSIVNINALTAIEGSIIPSHLKGNAQLQMFPPTIEIPDGSGTHVLVRMPMMARYFPDSQTRPLAEFVRGELQIRTDVSHIASQAGNMIEINVKADEVDISFAPEWSSAPVSAEDLAAINLLIRNALKTSFLPSNATLPPDIAHLQFKTLHTPDQALAMMLNIAGGAGNPGSVNRVFLGGGDDFAFAVGVDFVRAAFQPTIDTILSQPLEPVHVDVEDTFHVTYTISLRSISLDFQSGALVLTMQGHAQTPTSWMPDFDFTVRQPFTLAANGPTADLVAGDPSLHTSSWVVNLFSGGALSSIESVRDEALRRSGAANVVRKMLNADENLGGFLRSLLPPVRRRLAQIPAFTLSYSSAEISPDGIVLHGSLSVTDWPAAHVEFEQAPAKVGSGAHGGGAINQGPDYSALKSWIPGGRIQEYEWKVQGESGPGFVDDHTFAYLQTPSLLVDAGDGPAVSGYAPLCLTVRGVRLSSAGAVTLQPVTGSVCGYSSFPIVTGLDPALNGTLPLVALARPGPGGLVHVVGHTPALHDPAGSRTPNRLIHFADAGSAHRLEVLTRALRESGRTDAPTAVVAVLPPDLLSEVLHTRQVIYAEDSDATWRRFFGVKTTTRPLTLIVGPKGDIAWEHEGEVEQQTLAAALRRFLVRVGPIRVGMLPPAARVGQPPPNFVFEHVPGRVLTLRKLTGRDVILVFCRSALKSSVAAVRDLQPSSARHDTDGPVLLAIDDGESPQAGEKIAGRDGVSAIVVPDPDRQIATAYRVNVWPTIVFIDARGLVRNVHYGRFTAESSLSPDQYRSR